MKKKILIVLITTVFLLGCSLILLEPIKSLIRQNIIENSIASVESQIKSGDLNNTITIEVPDSDILSIVGEEEDDEGNLSDLLENIKKYNSGKTTLICIGILEIPALEIKEPIWDSCSKVALRYGVGRYPLSATIGGKGNTTILGHRNKHISTIFYRLQSIKKGTEVIITTSNGIQYKYVVSITKNVPPNKLDDYILKESSRTEQLTLVTCATEYGSGWRFLAICKKGEVFTSP